MKKYKIKLNNLENIMKINIKNKKMIIIEK